MHYTGTVPEPTTVRPTQMHSAQRASTPQVAARPTRGCTCFRLRKLARRVSRLYDAELASLGLRVTQYSLLATVARSGVASLAELAERMEMDRTTLSRNLRPLLAQGLLCLVPDPADARRRVAQATREGRARLKAATPAWQRAQRATEALLGPNRIDDLHEAVDDALMRLRAACDLEPA